MPEQLSLLAALMIGLLGSGHCMGMCGGIAASLTLGKGQSPLLLISYNLGRLSSYVLAGALIGGIGLALHPYGVVLRSFAALVMIATGLYIAQWWMGLNRLEAVGGYLWRYLQPLSRTLLPIDAPHKALLFGALWGWLPCGLVYSALIWSSSADSPLESATLMAAFGLGTLPAMMTTSLLASQVKSLLAKRLTRQISGLALIAMGLYTLPWPALKTLL